jgi:hypothetical protein
MTGTVPDLFVVSVLICSTWVGWQCGQARIVRDSPDELSWASTQSKNARVSPHGSRFLFTAVAYSGEHTNNPINQSEYYFALDPERAAGGRLYNVWARLQTAELQALDRHAVRDSEPCRKGYEGRGRTAPARFHDPWFDGHNYNRNWNRLSARW